MTRRPTGAARTSILVGLWLALAPTAPALAHGGAHGTGAGEQHGAPSAAPGHGHQTEDVVAGYIVAPSMALAVFLTLGGGMILRHRVQGVHPE